MPASRGPLPYATHADYAALRAQVNSIGAEQSLMRGELSRVSENMVTKSEMDNIARHIDNLSSQISSSSKTNWGVIFAGVGLAATVFGAVWVAGITPIKEALVIEIARHEQTRGLLDQRWLLFTTRQAHDDFKHDVERELNRMHGDHLTRGEWQSWKDERDKRLGSIESRMDRK